MGKLVFAGIVPHPPIIVKEVGGKKNQDAQKTITAMDQFAKEVKDANPDLIIMITSHGNIFRDGFAIHSEDKLKGDFFKFGARGKKYEFANHKELQSQIVSKAEENGFSMIEINDDNVQRYGLDRNLDHGTLVPMSFIQSAGVDVPIVVISMAILDREELYHFGMVLEEVILENPYNVAVIASGDLSHRLTEDAPAGYDPVGKDFDLQIVDIAKSGRLIDFMNIDEELTERAGECGLRPLIILSGVLDSYDVNVKSMNYEGPYGVGYLVASFNVTKGTASLLEDRILAKKEEIAKIIEKESPLVQLARESLSHYLKFGKHLPIPKELPDLLKENKSSFVTLKKNGHLRGCIGTIEPTRENLAAEIISNSISAGLSDPRFPAVTLDELDEIVFSVDVLSKPEKTSSLTELDPKVYGIIVEGHGRSGVLLPNLEGVDTVEEQLEITLNKAGLNKNNNYTIYRFKVDRYY